jgi:hypothetical protein
MAVSLLVFTCICMYFIVYAYFSYNTNTQA